MLYVDLTKYNLGVKIKIGDKMADFGDKFTSIISVCRCILVRRNYQQIYLPKEPWMECQKIRSGFNKKSIITALKVHLDLLCKLQNKEAIFVDEPCDWLINNMQKRRIRSSTNPCDFETTTSNSIEIGEMGTSVEEAISSSEVDVEETQTSSQDSSGTTELPTATEQETSQQPASAAESELTAPVGDDETSISTAASSTTSNLVMDIVATALTTTSTEASNSESIVETSTEANPNTSDRVEEESEAALYDCAQVDIDVHDRLQNITEHLPLCPLKKPGREIPPYDSKSSADGETLVSKAGHSKGFGLFDFLKGTWDDLANASNNRDNHVVKRTAETTSKKIEDKPPEGERLKDSEASSTVSDKTAENVSEQKINHIKLLGLAKRWRVEDTRVDKGRRSLPGKRFLNAWGGEKEELTSDDVEEKRLVGKPAFKRKKNKNKPLPPKSRLVGNNRRDIDEDIEYEVVEIPYEPIEIEEIEETVDADEEMPQSILEEMEEVMENLSEDVTTHSDCDDENTLLNAHIKVRPGLSELLKDIIEPGEKKIRITNTGGKELKWTVDEILK